MDRTLNGVGTHVVSCNQAVVLPLSSAAIPSALKPLFSGLNDVLIPVARSAPLTYWSRRLLRSSDNKTKQYVVYVGIGSSVPGTYCRGVPMIFLQDLVAILEQLLGLHLARIVRILGCSCGCGTEICGNPAWCSSISRTVRSFCPGSYRPSWP